MPSIKSIKEEQISSVEDWFQYAPPKKSLAHWKDGYSAKELAVAWFISGDARVPGTLTTLLDSHRATKDFVAEQAIPELKTKFDEFRGEGRNHDLVIWGKAKGHSVLVAIEAKASESFGRLVKQMNSERVGSHVQDRVKELSRSLFGRLPNKAILDLRYQLLTGVAGTLAEASLTSAERAVFVVHELRPNTDKAKGASKRNHKDFEDFVKTFPALAQQQIVSGKLYGPMTVPGNKYIHANVPLYIGLIETELPARGEK